MLEFKIITHGWSGYDMMSFTLPYLYANGTDVLSPNRRLLKNEILYILSSGSVTMDMIPPFLLRLIFFSVCTFTAVGFSPVP